MAPGPISSADITLRSASVAEPEVRALLLRHHALMRSTSPEESCHVMAPETLQAAGVHLLAAERAGEVVGIGGLAVIAPREGELKSMHTVQEARGMGVGRALLHGLINHARTLNLTLVLSRLRSGL